MIILHKSRTFKRTLLVASLAMLSTGCLHSDDDDPVVVPPVVTNTAPAITSTSVDASTEADAYTYTLTATDADNDTLTLSATTLPAWLTFDAATGVLSGTPATADVGDHPVVLSVSDGTAAAVTQSFTITVTAVVVVNTAPTITSTGVTTGTVGTAYSYAFTATDAEGDTLTNSAVSTLPAWAMFDADTGVLSGTPDIAGDYAIELMVSDGTDSDTETFTIVVSEASNVTVNLVVFENAALPGWAAWTDNGGPTALITDDVDHDLTTRFTLTKPSVAGFSARASETDSGTPFDASGIISNGTLSFDLKMEVEPLSAPANWFLKVEGTGAAQLNLSASAEGHATPVLDTWLTYTFPLSALDAAGNLDFSSIVLFMVFPDYNEANGAQYLLDNFKITSTAGGDTGGDNNGTELLTNGDFENGLASWKDVGTVVADGDTNVLEVTVNTATTNVYDINQSQIFDITEGETYTFSFRAKASQARTMVAGLGLNSGDFANISETVSLTTEWQTFTKDIVATGIGGVGSRVLFDMGVDVGNVNIDDVSVKLTNASSGGGETPVVATGLGFDFESDGSTGTWTVFENTTSPLEFVTNPDMSGVNTSATVAKFTAPIGAAFYAGTETKSAPTFTLDATNSTVRIMVYKTTISDVGIKFADANGTAQLEIKQPNTLINQWEEITFDMSGIIGLAGTTDIVDIVVFPDFISGERTVESVVYFDNITFSAN